MNGRWSQPPAATPADVSTSTIAAAVRLVGVDDGAQVGGRNVCGARPRSGRSSVVGLRRDRGTASSRARDLRDLGWHQRAGRRRQVDPPPWPTLVKRQGEREVNAMRTANASCRNVIPATGPHWSQMSRSAVPLLLPGYVLTFCLVIYRSLLQRKVRVRYRRSLLPMSTCGCQDGECAGSRSELRCRKKITMA